jgi:hypothetical protein
MGAYVSLLEYNGIEGMILLSELSRRRIRSITKLIKARGRSAPAAPRPGGGPAGQWLWRAQPTAGGARAACSGPGAHLSDTARPRGLPVRPRAPPGAAPTNPPPPLPARRWAGKSP